MRAALQARNLIDFLFSRTHRAQPRSVHNINNTALTETWNNTTMKCHRAVVNSDLVPEEDVRRALEVLIPLLYSGDSSGIIVPDEGDRWFESEDNTDITETQREWQGLANYLAADTSDHHADALTQLDDHLKLVLAAIGQGVLEPTFHFASETGLNRVAVSHSALSSPTEASTLPSSQTMMQQTPGRQPGQRRGRVAAAAGSATTRVTTPISAGSVRRRSEGTSATLDPRPTRRRATPSHHGAYAPVPPPQASDIVQEDRTFASHAAIEEDDAQVAAQHGEAVLTAAENDIVASLEQHAIQQTEYGDALANALQQDGAFQQQMLDALRGLQDKVSRIADAVDRLTELR